MKIKGNMKITKMQITENHMKSTKIMQIKEDAGKSMTIIQNPWKLMENQKGNSEN